MTIEAFKEYLSTTKLTFSYKAVLVLALLDVIGRDGKASTSQLIGAFHQFYLERQRKNLAAEKERERHPSPLIKPDEVTDEQIWQILARYPLELMEDYISVDGDIVRFKHNLWSQLSASDLVALKEIAQQRLKVYYEDIE